MPHLHAVATPLPKTQRHFRQDRVKIAAFDDEWTAPERWRDALALTVICVGLACGGFALWQAQNSRTVYVPIPLESTLPPAPQVPIAASGVATGRANALTVALPAANPPPRAALAAPAMPLTQTLAPSVPAATPVDYAARDRRIASLKAQIDALDEQIRVIRTNPRNNPYAWHYANVINDPVRHDAYVNELDRQRNELRREKWALEGR